MRIDDPRVKRDKKGYYVQYISSHNGKSKTQTHRVLTGICSWCGELCIWFSHNKRKRPEKQFCSISCSISDRNWKGGSHHNEGYVRLNGTKCYEHRSIAERVLGRPLKQNEVVHHINGNKADNRNCNLLICDVGYHFWLHQRMAHLYQREHFK